MNPSLSIPSLSLNAVFMSLVGWRRLERFAGWMWIVYLKFRGFLEDSLEWTRPFPYRRHDVYSYGDS